jgi:predicted membrane channel-forming protein YqfA (hemolysin III family)
VWQGHAAWHLLGAFAALFIFVCLKSDNVQHVPAIRKENTMAFLIGLIAFAVMMTAFLIAGWLDWGGDGVAKEPTNKYCESLHSGMIKQPANTWSDLGFVLTGLGILLFLTVRGKGADPNPMAQSNFLSILFGCLVIWLGPGSMFLHASQKAWGGWLDNLSMNMFVAFIPSYDLARVVKPRDWEAGLPIFLIVYLVLTISLALLTRFVEWESFGIATFIGLIVLAVAGELLVAFSDDLSRKGVWLIVGLVIFALAAGFWAASKTGGPLCRPDSVWQGHAAWHVLSAIASLFIFMYLASETVG